MRPIQYPTEEREWIKAEVETLKRKGVIADAVLDAYLHRIVLVSGRPDQPAQSGQKFRMCTDFCPIKRATKINLFPALDL